MHDLRLRCLLDFELLVRDLMREEFGVVLENIGPSRDSGFSSRFAQRSQATWSHCFAVRRTKK